MRSTAALFLLAAACDPVKEQPDARTTTDDASTTDAATVDAAPADAMRFASGSFGFEDVTGNMNPTTPLVFTNGVILSKPNPNPGDSTGLYILDCTGNSGAFGFGCMNSRQYIPDGVKTAVLPNLGSQGRFIEFTFPAPIGTFSVAVSNTDGSAGKVYRVVAMVNDVDVAMGDVTTSALPQWDTTRGTVVYAPGFTTVQIRNVGAVGASIMIDELRWTSDAP